MKALPRNRIHYAGSALLGSILVLFAPSASSQTAAITPVFTLGETFSQSDACSSGNLNITQNPPSNTVLTKGKYAVEFTVTDASGNRGVCTSAVLVRDSAPPAILAVTANPLPLNPPNHKIVPVTICVAASDNCDPAPVSQIISIASNQPETAVLAASFPKLKPRQRYSAQPAFAEKEQSFQADVEALIIL